LVVCGEVNKPYLDFPPALVAEILSPSSIIKDRNAKFSIYQSQHVRYYLILDVNLEKLEVFELINGKYELVATNPATFDFTFHDHCKTTIPFHNLWQS
jgi:Uma2 family endonuclease